MLKFSWCFLALLGCGFPGDSRQLVSSTQPFATGTTVAIDDVCPANAAVLDLAQDLEPVNENDCVCVGGEPVASHSTARLTWSSRVKGCILKDVKQCYFYFGEVECKVGELQTTWEADAQDNRKIDCGCSSDGSAAAVFVGSFVRGRVVTTCCK